jgi:hypothetical protein
VAEALREVGPVWEALYPAEQARIVRLLVAEVVVETDRLTIRLQTGGLASLVAELQSDGAALTVLPSRLTPGASSPPSGPSSGLTPQAPGLLSLAVHVPMKFRKRSGRKEIVLPEGIEAREDTDRDEHNPLVVAIARAHRWQEMLDTGEVASVAALAERAGLDASYVRRLLKLASLAPAVVEAVLTGRAPDGLSLAKLTRDLPPDWEAQLQQLGL